ncbi:MAG: EamA family transporter [Planctomycetota bacterium]|jgi:drug/metabolite transporter (DMT)-like permease
MHPGQKSAFLFAALAALLWSPHFYVVDSLSRGGVPALVLHFHLLFWPALVLLVGLFLLGRRSILAVFNRRETYFLILAAAGGYGFWVLRGMALESAPAGQARLWLCAAPLLMGLLSLFSAEKADRRVGMGLLLGLFGCILIVQGQQSGAEAAGGASARAALLALGAAACWALFSVLARSVVREESVLPVTGLVLGVGALCLLVTCISTGENPGAVSLGQLRVLALAGLVSVALMMAFWLKALAGMPAALAAPFWYLGVLFGLLWAGRYGWSISGWMAVGGAVLVLLGLQSALAGRRRAGVTIADIIRNST